MSSLSAAQRRRRFAVVTGIALGGAIALVILVVRLAADPQVTSNLGAETFEFDAAGQAEIIDRDRAPTLFPDLRNGDLNIFVNHIGDDPLAGWVAFLARTDEARCQVEWDRRLRRLRDCRGRVYPPDGAGLRQFATVVEDGEVVVDLRSRPTTTTSSSTSSTSSTTAAVRQQ